MNILQILSLIINFNYVCIGWTAVPESTTSIGFAQLHIADAGVKVSASLVIGDNFLFQVHMQGRQVPKQLFELETADCVGAVLGIMSKISSSRLCCGNPDEKFRPIIDARKGKFVDVEGN